MICAWSRLPCIYIYAYAYFDINGVVVSFARREGYFPMRRVKFIGDIFLVCSRYSLSFRPRKRYGDSASATGGYLGYSGQHNEWDKWGYAPGGADYVAPWEYRWIAP